jgi:DNA-binding transcriptional LysR family regulator
MHPERWRDNPCNLVRGDADFWTMADLSLDELKALSAVATHRSFRGAAIGLDMPPSSLSYLVAGVEKRLGVRLFNRTTRSVSVTEAGEAFLARVRPAWLEIVDAVETVNRFRSRPAGTVRINTSEELLLRVLPIVLEFMTAYPEVKVDLIVEGRFVDIVAEGFDAGLRHAESVPQDMVALRVGAAEETAVVATPDYLARRGVPHAPADLLNQECIRNRLPSGVVHRWEFERHGEVVRLDPPGRLTLSGARLGLRAARAGIGLAYVTERSAREDIAAGRLIRLLPEWTPPTPGTCLYYPRQRLPSPAFKAFLDYFRRRSMNADQNAGNSGESRTRG